MIHNFHLYIFISFMKICSCVSKQCTIKQKNSVSLILLIIQSILEIKIKSKSDQFQVSKVMRERFKRGIEYMKNRILCVNSIFRLDKN